MIDDTTMIDNLKAWLHGGPNTPFSKNSLQEARASAEESYQAHRKKINENHLNILDTAIENGYLNIHGLLTKQASPIFLTFRVYCQVHAHPIVTISTGWRKHLAMVTLDLDSVELPGQGEWDPYCPELDLKEEVFHVFTLLKTNYVMTNGYVEFRHVQTPNAEEVALQLLAFYDRQYQKRKQYIDSLLSRISSKGTGQS